MKKNSNIGLSIVELIVVISIMGVLLALVAPQFIKYVAKAKTSVDMRNKEAMWQAVHGVLADPELELPITVGQNTIVKITIPESLDGLYIEMEYVSNFDSLLVKSLGCESISLMKKEYEWKIVIANQDGGFTADVILVNS